MLDLAGTDAKGIYQINQPPGIREQEKQPFEEIKKTPEVNLFLTECAMIIHLSASS